jgi:hypothetical protein
VPGCRASTGVALSPRELFSFARQADEFEPAPTDETAGEGEEAFVDVVVAVGADQEAAAIVEPGEGALNDPALTAQPGRSGGGRLRA